MSLSELADASGNVNNGIKVLTALKITTNDTIIAMADYLHPSALVDQIAYL